MTDSFRDILDVQLKVSKALLRWSDGRLRNIPELVRKEDPTSKLCLVVGCLAIAREHHKGIVHLVDKDLVGPASGLVGVATEAFYRGPWLHRCASPVAWEHFRKDGGIKRKMHNMVEDLRKFQEPREESSPLLPQAWDHISGLHHAGISQLVMTSLISGIHYGLRLRERHSISILNLGNGIGIQSGIYTGIVVGDDSIVRDFKEKLAEHQGYHETLQQVFEQFDKNLQSQYSRTVPSPRAKRRRNS